MDDSKKKFVSIVIPCRNEENYIEKCVDSMAKQSYGIENIEVLVVDGMSTDRTQEIVNEYSKKVPNVKLVINEKKVAPVAMNLGIKKAKGDIIIIFGAHAYMDKDYVKNSVEKLKDDNIAVVGGRIINLSENDLSEAISLAMGSPFGVGNALFRYSDKEELVDTVAFGAYKREVFDNVGLFDEEFVRNQDDELNFRVSKAGYNMLLSPSIESHYYTRGSLGKLWKQYFQYGFWKVRVIQKHKRPASIRHLIPLIFVSGIIAGTILSIFSKVLMIMFLSVLGLYAALSLVYAVKACNSKYKYVPRIMLCFLILHLSYGLGFIEGIYTFHISKNYDRINKNTKMSR
ncbi:glycosyltransferase family 2 protein [Clostridium cylindrosporum]|uniref:Succinoglycan biosynthesis protein ExoA n=1 Tax=Clostridium cylindrosporum DSM 605 TaxID=1121307 RepID=A0A0J8DEF6_CLOCY|nr:glycosyltransferase family 2 protein [Clostridium cylindrosporum]KMT22609.1 succinoglycan biosynthesis protein ExoA [Clostridium cylindrosporum DSM 605]